MFAQAIVRPPAPNFAKGLTTASLGAPNYERAVAQHDAYCAALQHCGLKVTRLKPDPNYPDSCFVEDVAVTIEPLAGDRLTGPNGLDRAAILTRPGALSRRGEVESIRGALTAFFDSLSEVRSPGTLD